MTASTSTQFDSIKLLDESNYSNWEFRAKLILEQSKVLRVLEEETPQEQ